MRFYKNDTLSHRSRLQIRSVRTILLVFGVMFGIAEAPPVLLVLIWNGYMVTPRLETNVLGALIKS